MAVVMEKPMQWEKSTDKEKQRDQKTAQTTAQRIEGNTPGGTRFSLY
jgi:hypothetical protein